jgi:hypothetical protein
MSLAVPGRKLVGGSIAVALTAVVASTPSAFGAERVMLGEYFTWQGCVYCPPAGAQINLMVIRYGIDGTDVNRHDTLAVVMYNVWDAYQQPWGLNRAEVFYNAIFPGTPTFVHDGLVRADPYSTYIADYYARQAIPTPVTMTIETQEPIPNRYEVTVETCLEAGADPMTLRIYTIGVEDHYPPLRPYDRNGFRTAAATEDISLLPGECHQKINTMIVFPHTVQENVKFLAWAQDPSSTGPAEVHQAAIVAVPVAPPCPWDCGDSNGEVGINDFLAMLADWGSGGACDFDDDGVGITDFLALLANWGPCPE